VAHWRVKGAADEVHFFRASEHLFMIVFFESSLTRFPVLCWTSRICLQATPVQFLGHS